MRPYDPNIGPDVAENVMKAAARHGPRDAGAAIKAAEIEWKAEVGRIVKAALAGNMEERSAAYAVQTHIEAGDMSSARNRAANALDDVLAPLAPWTGHDWIGQVLGFADATNDEAVERLFEAAAKMVADAGFLAGVKERGHEAKFLSHQHITAKRILEHTPKMTEPQFTAEETPFVDFFDRVTDATTEMMGDDFTRAKVALAAKGDADAARTILQCGGYEDSEANIASMTYSAALVVQRTGDKWQHAQDAQLVETAPGPITQPPSGEPGTAAALPQGLPIDFPENKALATIRRLTSLKDPELGELLGVSRGTVANLAEGKAKKPMTAEGKQALYDKMSDLMSELGDAWAELIPAEPKVVIKG